jgi:glycerophosphoryl diester phosphodiesterase
MKRLFTIFAVLALLCCLAFCALAANESGLVAVSYRGDTTDAPPNSLSAIQAAFDAGADWVSVPVQKTRDGAFVLLEDAPLASQTDGTEGTAADFDAAALQTLHYRNLNGTVSDDTVATLEQARAAAVGKGGLILDNAWAYRDELHSLLNTMPAGSDGFLRTFESAKKALQWKRETGTKMFVLPVYKGNVVFNAIAHWNYLSTAKQPLVQFQSKNYFNVFYQKFTDKRFHAAAATSALAPMYDAMLCGRRSDDVAGWDDLISRGFAAIETGNIRGLVAYISQCEAERTALKALLQSSENAYGGDYSFRSRDRLDAARAAALTASEDGRASLSQLQSAESDLKTALRLLTPAGEKDVQKGTFQVTPGKVAVMIIFGGLLLGFDVFVYKKKKKT